MHRVESRTLPFVLLRLRELAVASLLVTLGFLVTSCGCLETCDQEIHIRSGEGAQGMVPGTVTAHHGDILCFKNDDAVTHRVIFSNSPGKSGTTAETLEIPAGGTKKLKINSSKPTGSYECQIDPPARTDGLWAPGEPQVVVE